MPSEPGRPEPIERSSALPDALRPRAEEFRSRLALASEEVRDWRIHHEEAVGDPAGVLAAELGPFAAGRIDPARLAGLVGVEDVADPVLHHLVALAEERFGRLLRRGSDAFVVTVAPGGDLRDAVRDALADLGTAFGFARAIRKARTRRFLPDEDHELLRPWPFHRWSPRELEMAPPLLIDVAGADLRASGLAEFLAGGVRMLLRVRGSTGPAPLARLITPDVFVAQCSGATGDVLDRLAVSEGAGIVGLFGEDAGAMEFVHDPSSGLALDIEELDHAIEAAADRRGASGLTDLRHLRGFVPRTTAGVGRTAEEEVPAVEATPVGGTRPAADDVDRLAGWLLSNLPADAGDG